MNRFCTKYTQKINGCPIASNKLAKLLHSEKPRSGPLIPFKSTRVNKRTMILVNLDDKLTAFFYLILINKNEPIIYYCTRGR